MRRQSYLLREVAGSSGLQRLGKSLAKKVKGMNFGPKPDAVHLRNSGALIGILILMVVSVAIN